MAKIGNFRRVAPGERAVRHPGWYYRKAVLIPSGIIISGYILFFVYDLTIGPGKNYKSEWLTADSFDEYMLGMVFVHCVILSLLCSSILLAGHPKVRANPALVCLSWFFLPALYLGYLLFRLWRSIMHGEEEWDTCLAILSLTLPYVISLSWTFVIFKRGMRLAK